MKKTAFVVVNPARGFMFAVFVAGLIAEKSGGLQKTSIIEPGREFDIPKIMSQYRKDGYEPVIIGDIRGAVENRLAFENRITLMDQLLIDNSLQNDPAFAEIVEQVNSIYSPYSEQNTYVGSRVLSVLEEGRGNEQYKKISQVLRESLVPNQEVSDFLSSPAFSENYQSKMIKVDKTFLSRPFALGVLSINDSVKPGISMRAVVQHSFDKTKNPVDHLLVIRKRSVELVYNPWAHSAVNVVKESLLKNNFTAEPVSPQNKNRGLIFNWNSAGQLNHEQIVDIVKSAMEKAENAVLNPVTA